MLCLPPKDITPKKQEYVFTSGWGIGYEEGRHLKIGTRLINGGLVRGAIDMNHTIYSYSIWENGVDLTRVCLVSNDSKHLPSSFFKFLKGDSGSPIWQYYNGKAVILGVNSRGDGKICETEVPDYSYGPYVPQIMDWILNEMSK